MPNPESALNEEAGRLLLEQYEDYAKHARIMTNIHAQSPVGRQLFEARERSGDEPTPSETSTPTAPRQDADTATAFVKAHARAAAPCTTPQAANKVLTHTSSVNVCDAQLGSVIDVTKSSPAGKCVAPKVPTTICSGTALVKPVRPVATVRPTAGGRVAGGIVKPSRAGRPGGRTKTVSGPADKKRGLRRL